MPPDVTPSTLENLSAQNRYVYSIRGDAVGLTDYRIFGNDIHVTHTEIDPQLRGSGLGAQMVEAVLNDIRTTTELRVVAECPFVVDWLSHHPDYHDVERRGV